MKGVIKLNGAKFEDFKDEKKEHGIQITVGDEVFKIAADAADVKKEWMEALKTAASGKKTETKVRIGIIWPTLFFGSSFAKSRI